MNFLQKLPIYKYMPEVQLVFGLCRSATSFTRGPTMSPVCWLARTLRSLKSRSNRSAANCYHDRIASLTLCDPTEQLKNKIAKFANFALNANKSKDEIGPPISRGRWLIGTVRSARGRGGPRRSFPCRWRGQMKHPRTSRFSVGCERHAHWNGLLNSCKEKSWSLNNRRNSSR